MLRVVRCARRAVPCGVLSMVSGVGGIVVRNRTIDTTEVQMAMAEALGCGIGSGNSESVERQCDNGNNGVWRVNGMRRQ